MYKIAWLGVNGFAKSNATPDSVVETVWRGCVTLPGVHLQKSCWMFSHKLMNGIQRHAIIRLPVTLMICSIVMDDENDMENF